MKPGSFLIPALVVFLVFGVYSCSKNGNNKPKLSLESISSPVKPNDSMIALLKFTNPGDKLGNGAFYSIRNRLNQTPVPAQDSSGTDTLINYIPDFEGASKGEFRYALPYSGYLSESHNLHQNDTLIFKFFVINSQGDSSDMIASQKVIIINP